MLFFLDVVPSVRTVPICVDICWRSLSKMCCIGSRTVQAILENREWHSQLFHQRFNIKAIFDSSGFVYNGSSTGDYGSCIADGTLVNVMEWKQRNKNPLRVFRDIGHYYTDFERMMPNLLGGNDTILVDCTNDEEGQLTNVFVEHSKKGGGVIFANKKVLSSSQHTFDNVKCGPFGPNGEWTTT